MAPTSSSDAPAGTFTAHERRTMLRVAMESVLTGLRQHRPLRVHAPHFTALLQASRATFVTVYHDRQLQGCIGCLEPRRPLIADVARNAFSAAFRDERFTPVDESHLPALSFHISVLHPPEVMNFTSEDDLLRQLRPGIDGLILTSGAGRGTFLPAVWEKLPTPALFLEHLKQKAGLPADYWSDDIRVARYTVESVA